MDNSLADRIALSEASSALPECINAAAATTRMSQTECNVSISALSQLSNSKHCTLTSPKLPVNLFTFPGLVQTQTHTGCAELSGCLQRYRKQVRADLMQEDVRGGLCHC